MKCPNCDSNIVVGFDHCIVCNRTYSSRESIPYKYFVMGFFGLFLILESTKGFGSFGEFAHGVFVSSISAIVFGAITWLFYEIFGKICRH